LNAIDLRVAAAQDIEPCARIMYEAFTRIAEQGGFPPYHASPEAARQLIAGRIEHPAIFGVVARADDAIVGCNFLDQRGPIHGVGPITVDPHWHGRGVGRRLMEAALERGKGAPSIRLLQDAHNPISLSLYASLGFDVKDITVQLAGRCDGAPEGDLEVRPLAEGDVEDCARLHREIHGFERTRELRDALDAPSMTPVVAIRAGRVRAYATTFAPWQAAHGTAATETDMRGLISGAAALSPGPMAFLLPVRQAELFRWCLTVGFRAVRPMTYMVLGDYQEPHGAWFPSVLY
jgi:GNAT superfamily N-acetyltransferase